LAYQSRQDRWRFYHRISANRFSTGPSWLSSVRDNISKVRVGLYTLGGRLVRSVIDRQLCQGDYRINPFSGAQSSQLYVLSVQVGNSVTFIKRPLSTVPQARLEYCKRRITPTVGARYQKPRPPLILFSPGPLVTTWAGWRRQPYRHLRPGAAAHGCGRARSRWSRPRRRGDMLAQMPSLTFVNDDASVLPTATITPSTTFQSIVGFGAAFTETAVYNLCKITPAKKGPGP